MPNQQRQSTEGKGESECSIYWLQDEWKTGWIFHSSNTHYASCVSVPPGHLTVWLPTPPATTYLSSVLMAVLQVNWVSLFTLVFFLHHPATINNTSQQLQQERHPDWRNLFHKFQSFASGQPSLTWTNARKSDQLEKSSSGSYYQLLLQ